MANLSDGLSQNIIPTPNTNQPWWSGWFGLSSDPNAAMANEDFGQINIPADKPDYFFRIEVANYSRRSWSEVGDLTFNGSLNLPIPASLVDTHSVSWEGEELGVLGGATMNVMGGGNPLSVFGDNFLSGAGRAAAVAAQAIGGQLVPGPFRGVEASLGVAINNFLTMMLKGPTYKKHQFSWRVSPSSERESDALKRLYVIMNNAQAPGLSSWGSAFFRYPKIFQLSFMHKERGELGDNLYRFKPAALTNSSWNFAPQSIPSFHGKTNAPTSLEFSLEFTELEYWLAGDFGGSR